MRITNALFRNGRRFQVETEDFRHFSNLVAKEIVAQYDDGSYKMFRVSVGAKSDIASTPPEVWAKAGVVVWLPPFGPYAPDAYAHDSAYQNTLEVFDPVGRYWTPANLSKDESDELLKALMFSGGVDPLKAEEIYQGVHVGGWRAFREDRSAQ